MCDIETRQRFDKTDSKLDKILDILTCHSVEIAEIKKDIKTNSEQHIEINNRIVEITKDVTTNTKFINGAKAVLKVLVIIISAGIIKLFTGAEVS